MLSCTYKVIHPPFISNMFNRIYNIIYVPCIKSMFVRIYIKSSTYHTSTACLAIPINSSTYNSSVTCLAIPVKLSIHLPLMHQQHICTLKVVRQQNISNMFSCTYKVIHLYHTSRTCLVVPLMSRSIFQM